MKKISKNIILMITVLSLIGFYGIPNKSPDEMNLKGDFDEKQTAIEDKPSIPNSATSHAPIFIDGDDPANDWDDCDAVTGSGTVEDPYVIEDLEIDAGESGSGILIQDSTAYLKISNCTAINAGSNSEDAGLRIEYCDNINVFNCDFTNNSRNGIYLYSSSYNSLTGNTIANNPEYGIYLYSSSYNSLTGNTIANNPEYGIFLDSSSNNNILTSNTVANNTYAGIYLISSSDNTLTGNTVVNNSEYGISLYSSSDNTLTGNTVVNNSDYGIYLISSSDNNGIFYNVINSNLVGIHIDSASSASIFDNWIWDNADYDIYENGGEANGTYVYNYYAEFCPLYDTDKDGLSDGEEFTLHTSPVKIDTDDDNLLDGFEVKIGTDPLNDDSDGDSWNDGIEVASGTNPLDLNDYPGLDEPLDPNPPIGLIIGGIGGFIIVIGTIGAVFFKQRKKK